jgi:PAS domain S-box-containing protein
MTATRGKAPPLGTASDAEGAFPDSEQLFARFMENLPGLAWAKDLDGRYVYANEAAAKAFRSSRQELRGKTDEELFPPETAAQFRENDRLALAGQTGIQTIEVLEQADGVAHQSLVSKFPIAGRDGRPTLIGGIAIDITERRRAEQELAELRDQLAADLGQMVRLHEISTRFVREGDVHALLEELLDGALAITGADRGGIQLVDPKSEVMRIAVQRGFDSGLLAFFDQVPAQEAACAQGIASNGRLMVEDVASDPFFEGQEGRRLLLEAGILAMQSTPLLSRSGKLLGLLSTHFRQRHRPAERELRLLDVFARQAADLIDRQWAEEALQRQAEALREADVRKDEFLATLAHELRNPLAPIRNALQILKLSSGDLATSARMVGMMERQLQQLVRLVDDLLDVSRVTRGRIELRRQTVELAAVVRSAVELSQSLIEAGNHQLSLELPRDTILLEADPTRLAQVFANLLNNAAKYTEPGGRIRIAVRPGDGEVAVSVSDDGIGIPAEMLGRVFEMFQQVDASPERSRGGLGIGLTLVRTLVRMHGGSVEARSGGVGKGSEFVVRLPVLLSGAEPGASPPSARSHAGSTRRRILVVDDNVDAAESLAGFLELVGHEVCVAHDGASALREARDQRPDVVLLDIGLPGADGYEVARALRREPGLEGTLLVAVTGYGREEDRRRSKEAGFERHLVKPIDPASLLDWLGDPSRRGSAR